MKKIQFFIERIGYGGKEGQVLTLANSLVSLFEIEIVCIERNRDISVDKKITIIELGEKKNFFDVFNVSLKNDVHVCISRFNPDIIINNDESFLKIIKKDNYRDKKLIYWVHNMLDVNKYFDLLKAYDFVVVSSKFLKGILGDCLNVVVIPDACDIDFRKKDYTFDNEMITVTKLDNVNKFLEIIEVVKEISLVKKNIKLKVVGDGSNRKNIEALIKKEKMENYIKLLGYYSSELLFQEMVDSSIYVSFNRNAIFDLPLLEAMSIGLPVVAFDEVTSINEIVSNEIDGLLVKDKDEMIDLILELCSDKKRRHLLGNCAIENASNFDVKRIKIEWMKLFK